MIVNVIVDLKNKQVNQSYSYLIPKYLEEDIFIGQRVFVEFGRQKRIAFIVGIKDTNESDFELKEITDIVDLDPLLDEEMLLITKELLEYPQVLMANVFETMIPSIFHPNYQKKVILLDKENIPQEFLEKFNTKGEWVLKEKDSRYNLKLLELRKKQIIEFKTSLVFKAQDKFETVYKLNPNNISKLTEKQSILVESITDEISREEALQIVSPAIISSLIKKEVLIESKVLKRREIKHNFDFIRKDIILNENQQSAYDSLSKEYVTNLLFGVNASGKTEVYLKWIADCIKNNQKALIIVPNSILLPSLVQRVKATFNSDIVAVVNASYKNSNRYDEIEQIYDDSKQIIIGTKESIFLKINDLGLIIIDEEQSSEYIIIDNPSYDIREISKTRAKYNNIPLVLVSATPSLKSYYKAINNEYNLLELTKKAINNKPNIITKIDMKNELINNRLSTFSNKTVKKINETINNNEQVLVLMNKKGFAPIVMCETCGYIPKCPDCDRSLTFYYDEFKLKCNNCTYSQRYSKTCPKCSSQNMHQLGYAIDSIKKELEEKFNQKVVKVDSESISKQKQGFETIYNKITTNQTKIILGTQLISKGVNFDNVALVVILKIEDLLNLPISNADFLTYSLLVQTINRTGRVKQGEVIIQAYDFSNPLFNHAFNNDYKGFYRTAILNRELLKEDPFYEVSQIILSNPSLLRSNQKINLIKKYLEENKVYTLGPTPTKTLNPTRLNEQLITLKSKNKLDYNKLNQYLETIKDKDTNITFYRYVK